MDSKNKVFGRKETRLYNSSLINVNDTMRAIIHNLTRLWGKEHVKTFPNMTNHVISISNGEYLYDQLNQRLVAAWAISKGRLNQERDSSRQRGLFGRGNLREKFPEYDKGHAIPHIMGGGLDINLIVQLKGVNHGDFKRLATKAVNSPGALYFTYWKYNKGTEFADINIPVSCHQGLLIPGKHFEVWEFPNVIK